MTLTAPVPTVRRRPRPAFHPLTVSAVDRLCSDATAVTFRVPPELADAYSFRAGQALNLRRRVDGEEQRRSYSICAAEGEALRIGVREIPGGAVSSWLVHGLTPGAVVEVQTPTGGFRADPGTGGRHLCVAAGSGITPLLSVAGTVLADPRSEVTLLYGNRTSGSVMFAEELADLKDRYGPRFSLIHVLSREAREVELFSGRLDADRFGRLLDVLVDVPGLDHVWLCGPLALIEGARRVLAARGVHGDRVHVELFYADAPPPELRRLDPELAGETSEVTVVLDGLRSTARMLRDTTVLDAASASRSDLPYACKGGVCGTCRAKVTAGEVTMRRNYALEPAEVDAGFVLTCQSEPVTDAVTVDFDV